MGDIPKVLDEKDIRYRLKYGIDMFSKIIYNVLVLWP